MDAVKQFGEYFIAPPPNDFLDESLKLFRKFIKPVLNAGVVDFEIFSESRQGDIRASVAEKIRELRHNDEEELKSRSDLYKAKDVLGLYKVFPADINVKSEDAIDDSSAGGIICVGRGAYKEYLSGVHEGLLGPLESHKEQSNLKPVPLRYIKPEDYANAQLAPELDLSTVVKDDKGCSYSLNNQCTHSHYQTLLDSPIFHVKSIDTLPKDFLLTTLEREQLLL
ncbi:Inner membrane protein import complex subunit Tim54 family protein [Candida albicans]|uniref:Mitochondrial import inner membrane translocase subunit TIM54 n=1 Tax=Candida albicans TaxID=5476 RepID=A0A8H6BSJ0_CANAX|nr:Inner membrane protein import complex subunit Tim54 family protein [Candida albicans]